ncbi:MAG: hypothetical protein JWM69_637 [Candidatus Binatus sp.]|jgi:hypothetical protein|nr:hypothetical protein [Candidatus Binatus sp.]
MRTNDSAQLVGREERRDQNVRTLKILLAVMLMLVAISFVTVLLKH